MERASKELPLERALEALRGALTAEDALLFATTLILLRHEAEAERAYERGEQQPALDAWHTLTTQDFGRRRGQEMSEVIRSGLGKWESDHGKLSRLPNLAEIRGSQLAPLIECVAAAQDLAALFDRCLAEQTLAMGKGGYYNTPADIARLLIGLMEPRAGETIYDPACGSGGFLLRASEYVESPQGGIGPLALYGQDVSRTALQTAAINFAVHDLTAGLKGPASSLTQDLFPDEIFDVAVANPPFNLSRWDEDGRARYDHRWVYGVPPAGNANFAWVQHVLSKISPKGRAGLLLPTGAAFGAKSAERHIRAGLVESDVLSCVVELPAGLIPHVRNPVSLWLFSKSKKSHGRWGNNDRSRQYLLIDARDTALPLGRGRRTIPDEVRGRITETFAAWRGVQGTVPYEDVPGWCRSVSTKDIVDQGYDVLPSHYMGRVAAEVAQIDRVELVTHLTDELYKLFSKAHRLEGELRDLLDRL
ncbi:N-6 DNA methylase [Nonomuraea sp. WAC 01424]|uniref:N-6 DNA methylase n=1 Tax=Nonomuraea sp. WAC 01424 TaxID=2203200 RepID=UPI000F780D8B|nr:N-6 DNA methylase [Nonomuraea sp. WAC 01424]